MPQLSFARRGLSLIPNGLTLRNLLVVGCVGVQQFACLTVPAEDSSNNVVEIFSWWNDGGESEALDALIQLHEQQYRNTFVVNAAEVDAQQARQRLIGRLSGGDPPDLFQANVGLDLGQWVLFNGKNDTDSKVEPLDELANAQSWFDAFPAEVLDAASYDGHLYGIPLNIHRENALFYNKPLFGDLGLDPPGSLEDLFALCELFQAQGITPLSFGGIEPWPFGILVFENILLATSDADFYRSYFAGEAEPDDPRIETALQIFQRLWMCTNRDANQIKWDEGVARLARSDVAMSVMGDWAKGLLQSKGLVPGEDFEQIAFPGTERWFVFTADTFAMPRGAPNPKGAERFLTTVGSALGQNTFNPIKGSIPARTDIATNHYDAVAQRTIGDFAEAAGHNGLVRALSGLAPSAFLDELNAALQAFTRDIDDPDRLVSADSSIVLFALKNNYDRLYTR